MPAEPLPPDLEALRPALARGLRALELDAGDAFDDGLLRYLALLERWNAAYNLVAAQAPADMLARHLFDSLAVARFIGAGPLADLGSGAGLPGIPLALLDPTREVILVESNGKKARFLRTAVRELELRNVVVHAQRAEDGAPLAVPWVTARALAPLRKLLRLAAPWLREGGQLLALKGPGVMDEIADLPKGFDLISQHRLQVPGLDAERWLVVFKRAPAAH